MSGPFNLNIVRYILVINGARYRSNVQILNRVRKNNLVWESKSDHIALNYGDFCRHSESICVDGAIDITSRLDREIIDLSQLCHFSVDVKTIINRTFSIRVVGDYFEGTRWLNVSRICNASQDEGNC